jgi:hypothetical protein
MDASVRFVRTEDISADTSSDRHFLSTKPSSRAARIQSQQSAFWLHFALFNMIGGIDTSGAPLHLLNRDVPSLSFQPFQPPPRLFHGGVPLWIQGQQVEPAPVCVTRVLTIPRFADRLTS